MNDREVRGELLTIQLTESPEYLGRLPAGVLTKVLIPLVSLPMGHTSSSSGRATHLQLRSIFASFQKRLRHNGAAFPSG
jgi:hypothetical protein